MRYTHGHELHHLHESQFGDINVTGAVANVSE